MLTNRHHVGDLVLVEAAKCFEQNIRSNDFIGRQGGEEFLVILPNTNEEGAKLVANRLLSTVFNLNIAHADSNLARVTISAGVATKHPDDNKTIDFTMLQADKSLYAAKGLGRNCVVSSVETAHNVMESEA